MHARHGRFDLQYKHMSPSSYISLQAQLYTGPRPCGKLWSPCTFLWVSLPAKFYCFGISPFTSFCILHYQLQFRDYGGSLAHRLQARFLLYAAGTYISRFAEEGSRTFFLLTSLQIRVRQRSTTSQRRLRSQFSRYFTVNSTFETLGEALHIVSNLAFSHMQLECTFFFC